MRAALHIVAVVAACLVCATIALATFGIDRRLPIGTVHVSLDPGHEGALDVYVPLVDWGVRFRSVRMPARLRIDVRSIDRPAAVRLAEARQLDVARIRDSARDAVASYIRLLLAVMFGAGLALGALVALVLRTHPPPRLGWLFATALATSLALVVAVGVLLPPRGNFDDPQYYAHGPDIPRALTALQTATRSAGGLSDELNAQLVGLARFVSAPAERRDLGGLPTLTVASDLHNNVLALPTLENAARGGPLLFPGDLTDRGTALETTLVRRIVRTGDAFVFVTGNHDSRTLARRLARAGAVVLTERGRIRRDGSLGARIVRVGGLRIAGYSDPNELGRDRRRVPRREPSVTAVQQAAFVSWLRPLLRDVDVVMVHEPALAATALRVLRADPPRREITFVMGHTHRALVHRSENLTVVNGGTAGGGGTGNLTEGQPVGLALLTYEPDRRFRPLAVDLVEIDPANGSARAERRRLEQP